MTNIEGAENTLVSFEDVQASSLDHVVDSTPALLGLRPRLISPLARLSPGDHPGDRFVQHGEHGELVGLFTGTYERRWVLAVHGGRQIHDDYCGARARRGSPMRARSCQRNAQRFAP
jgi:hypothetical protein